MPSRSVRWSGLLLLATSGGLLLQTGCDIIQTGLLAVIAGTTFWLARNV